MKGLPIFSILAVSLAVGADPRPPPEMALIPGGSYKPQYSQEANPRKVDAFYMDITQVTNAQFLDFVTAHPEWRRSQVSRSLADASYLQNWTGDLEPGVNAPLDAPVTHVSWHAASAYCRTHSKRLPTQDEWEFAARADAENADASASQAFLRQLLEWYSKPASAPLPAAADGLPNLYGVRGLHGVVWEWVEDFNSTMATGDSRGDAALDRNLFCGAGSLLAADVGNYAAFMRYAFRSSLKGAYCVGSLGFRAAMSPGGETAQTAGSAAATVYDLPGEWRGQNGKPVTLASLRGKIRVLTMGFTRCKSACPRIFGDMQRIETELGGDAHEIGFVFLSIDPQNDTPAQLARTLEERRMDPRRWTLLAAPDGTVRRAAVALDFKYQMVEGFFAHSNLIAIIDADGLVVHREETLGADIMPAVRKIRDLLNHRAKPE